MSFFHFKQWLAKGFCQGFAVVAFLLLYGEAVASGHFQIGWASTDISPDKPVLMRRGLVSTGIKDPITATVLVLDQAEGGRSETVVMISCDLLHITDGNRSATNMLGTVRSLVKASVPEIPSERIIMMATHTHVAPSVRADQDYNQYASGRIAKAVEQAWNHRQAGGISFGLGHAVVGHNRIATYNDGSSHMTGSFQKGSTANRNFSHIEGFEDHSVHLLYTWDGNRKLTGVVINVACPAQVRRGSELSADYWHDARQILGQSLGKGVFILPQVSAAGDIATTVMVEKKGEKRMQELMAPETDDFREQREKQIAIRISRAVMSVLPYMEGVIETEPVLAHKMAKIDLPGGFPDPDADKPAFPVELHVVRIGDIAIATNPFELYLDYGVRIKGRSPAVQTFIVELAGSASYLPTYRAVAGGGYGAIPKTSVVGPLAGGEIVDTTVEMLRELWRGE